jgi:uncharacterized protein
MGVSDSAPQYEPIKIPLTEPVHGLDSVTGRLGVPEWWPTGARVSVVIAQASLDEDPLLDTLQKALTERKYLTLRFPMPYMVAEKKKPDDALVMVRTYQAAMQVLSQDPSAAPAYIFAGGKNAGAIAAAHAATTRLRIQGLFFLGYPLHKQGAPKDVRADRLYRVITPMLFVQGSKDRHCELPALRKTLTRVGAPVNLHVVEEADHQLHVAKKSPRSQDEVNREVLAVLETWIRKTLGSP